jgi:hypothetical protein
VRLSADHLVSSVSLGAIEGCVGAGKRTVGRFAGAQHHDAGRDRHRHARGDGAPVEIGDDRAQAIERTLGGLVGGFGQDQQEFLAAIAAELVDAADIGAAPRRPSDGRTDR